MADDLASHSDRTGRFVDSEQTDILHMVTKEQLDKIHDITIVRDMRLMDYVDRIIQICGLEYNYDHISKFIDITDMKISTLLYDKIKSKMWVISANPLVYYFYNTASRLWEQYNSYDTINMKISMMLSGICQHYINIFKLAQYELIKIKTNLFLDEVDNMIGVLYRGFKTVQSYTNINKYLHQISGLVYDPKFINKLNVYPNLLPIKDGKILDMTDFETDSSHINKTQHPILITPLDDDFDHTKNVYADDVKDDLVDDDFDNINYLKLLKVRDRTDKDNFTFEYNAKFDFDLTKHETLARLVLLRKFKRFVSRLMIRCKEMVSFLHRILGYSITGHIIEQCIFIFKGDGSNGKSRLMELLSLILDDAYLNANREVVFGDDKPGPAPFIMELMHKRIATQDENSHKDVLNMNKAKKMTNERLKSRNLYRQASDFLVFFKLFLLNNFGVDIPPGDASSYSTIRRLVCVPFYALFNDNPDPNAKIPIGTGRKISKPGPQSGQIILEDEFEYYPYQFKKNPNITNIFKTEDGKEAVLYWLLLGFRRWRFDVRSQTDGNPNDITTSISMNIPSWAKFTVESVLAKSDPVEEFIRSGEYDITVNDEAKKTRCNELYDRYNSSTYPHLEVKEFGTIMHNKGFYTWKSNSIAYYVGIARNATVSSSGLSIVH